MLLKNKCMNKMELKQLTFELIDQLKYLREENAFLKQELEKSRQNFLEAIDKWNASVDKWSMSKDGAHSNK